VRSLRSVAVFCGSSLGTDPRFERSAVELGTTLVRRGIGLVYGGGAEGLMGALADAVLTAGGEATGVTTEAILGKESPHQGLTELQIVSTMHERKAIMADRADAFVMLAGGFGTLEEFLEAVTWTQLGVHDKPCGIYDPVGYYRPLMELIDSAVQQGFVRLRESGLVVYGKDPDQVLDGLSSWHPDLAESWIGREDR
jgi:uncharacterized protein (TIGR00730 family)